MLSKLIIENYALIDHLEIDFSAGFSVITGETGAGKSILLGAISLILGQRGDTSILLNKSKKCIVEGFFQTKDYNLEDFFSANQLDQDDITILRREISQTGKSRAFINDTPVTLGLLKALGDRLVNIHSQHSVVTLNNSDFQLAIIDSYADNQHQLELYQLTFSDHQEKTRKLDELIRKENQLRTERDYFHFLFNELDEAGIREGEQEESEQLLEVLSHAEEIKSDLSKISDLLAEGEHNTLDQLSDVITSLEKITRYRESLKDLTERVRSDFIDLKDIAREIGILQEEIQVDPKEIEKRSRRLDQIYALEKKHNLQTTRQLITLRDTLAQRLQEEVSLVHQIEELTTITSLLKSEAIELAETLSKKRQKYIPEIEKKIVGILKNIGIPDARIHLELNRNDELSEDGLDGVRFLFSGNKGIEMDEVSKIASGGEQSRLMLSIKSMISRKNLLPTIILDEIDSGVSGNVAGKVASILKNMGKTMQVLAITHLPQIAGQGESHYKVYKTSDSITAQTHIKKLNRDERIMEIAMMLSNNNITSAAKKTAEELLST